MVSQRLSSSARSKMSVLGDRLMVGHLPLEESILVRVQVPQLSHFPRLLAGSTASMEAFIGVRVPVPQH